MKNEPGFTSIDPKDLHKRLLLGSQAESGWCGPASLLYVAYEQKLIKIPDQKHIAKLLGTTNEKGTSHKMMLEGSKILGLKAYWLENTTLKELFKLKEQGSSVILNWMDGRDPEEDGHYSLLIGYKEKLIYLQDPNYPERITVMKESTFENNKIWFDICDNKTYYHSALILNKR